MKNPLRELSTVALIHLREIAALIHRCEMTTLTVNQIRKMKIETAIHHRKMTPAPSMDCHLRVPAMHRHPRAAAATTIVTIDGENPSSIGHDGGCGIAATQLALLWSNPISFNSQLNLCQRFGHQSPDLWQS